MWHLQCGQKNLQIGHLPASKMTSINGLLFMQSLEVKMHLYDLFILQYLDGISWNYMTFEGER
jgi:hypothetical protein